MIYVTSNLGFTFKNGTITSSNAPVIQSSTPMTFYNITVSSTSKDDQKYLIDNAMNVYLDARCTFTIPSETFFSMDHNAYLFNDLLVSKLGKSRL